MPRNAPHRTERITIRIRAHEAARIRGAALTARETLSEWTRRHLLNAARAELLRAPDAGPEETA